jgi:hypothetical protein
MVRTAVRVSAFSEGDVRKRMTMKQIAEQTGFSVESVRRYLSTSGIPIRTARYQIEKRVGEAKAAGFQLEADRRTVRLLGDHGGEGAAAVWADRAVMMSVCGQL